MINKILVMGTVKKKPVELVSICQNFVTKYQTRDKFLYNNIAVNHMKLPGWEQENNFMENYFEKLPTELQRYIFKFIKHWKIPREPKFLNNETVLFVNFYKPHQYVRILDYMIHVMKVTTYHEWDYKNERWLYFCDYKKKLKKIDEKYLYKIGETIPNID